jgi:protein-export SecD/SecF family membrane protein
MNSKSKSIISLLILLVVTVALVVVAVFGVGEKNLLGVKNIKQGLDLAGGAYIVFEADKEAPTDQEMSTAVALLQDRLSRKGYTEAEAAKQGSKKIRVDIPGVEDADAAVNEIGQTAQLMFATEDGQVVLTGSQVTNATKQVGSMSQGTAAEPYVALEFDAEGTKAFATATANNIGKRIYIMLDQDVVSAPTVNSAIEDGGAIITGSFTAKEAEDLAALIRAGSLPFNLKVVDMKNTGARLGADALSTSILGGVIGSILVFLFMLVMYRLSGFCADWALVIYICLELIVLSAFGLTLTLPGIAGIVLSIGMAVDANVIIFERTKEELKAGKSLRSALDLGYKRAFSAILDGNVTTLISAAVLFWLGTGPIKGFATTLAIGIVLSMFTALVVTRFIATNVLGLGFKNLKLYGVKASKEETK